MTIASRDGTLKQEIMRRKLGHCAVDGTGGTGRKTEPSVPRILRERASHRGDLVDLKGQRSFSSLRWEFPAKRFSRSQGCCTPRDPTWPSQRNKEGSRHWLEPETYSVARGREGILISSAWRGCGRVRFLGEEACG